MKKIYRACILCAVLAIIFLVSGSMSFASAVSNNTSTITQTCEYVRV